MPPKKKPQVPEGSVYFGRIGTSLKIGIVGLPNVGKSTFFNLLTKSQVASENYPFCTIEPNESRVSLPDQRFDFLCDFHKPQSKVPSFLHVTDIAGLVKGAHEGQGLGNAFLSHISSCDAIYHMLRIFEDENVVHVEGDVNPIRDMEIIHEELRMKDCEYLRARICEMEKIVQRGAEKSKKPEYDLLLKVNDCLETQKRAIRFCKWSNAEIEMLNKHLFLTSKPHIYLINMSAKNFAKKKSKWLQPIKEFIDINDSGAHLIPFSAENELNLLNEPLESASIGSLGCSALPKIIKNGFQALNLECFFTCGPDEVRAWTIHKGTKAPQAGGRIHTDFEKGFIMAEVMKYIDFKECGSEAEVKSAGKYLQKGREYVVDDGDIILFRFNAGAGLSKGKK
ncbi:Obg-like ATPase 1 [Oopsacas minuta]|uniref:Obg-like ATPase 1 n=1 Tax=Oopsacas minuta TaxID=111878 RepID=A0AAV7JT41_9METZ|nr:Obg-like ATPase 1 [Oopsacas minuta]